jgi:hypothetical protein
VLVRAIGSSSSSLVLPAACCADLSHAVGLLPSGSGKNEICGPQSLSMALEAASSPALQPQTCVR